MDSSAELVVWTLISLLLFVAGTLAAWRAEHQPSSWTGQFSSRFLHNPYGRALLFFVRFLYYICIPYIALMRHALSPVVAGLAGTQMADLPWWTLGWTLADWATAIGWMAGLGSIAASTLALGWWNAHRAMGVEFPTGDMLPAPSALVTVRESLYAEIHWAFYRAAPSLLIADPYWAVLVGAGLVLLEWILDPAWRAGLADEARRPVLLMQMAWFAISTSVFALTRNVWPALVLHVLLAWAIGRWVELLASRRTAVAG